ncbi:MAG: hypothetical protein JWP10_854 [Nocardioidaceae bacterium]|nr:hypothetical protein [Nocardioidaceae bacterium]
MEFGRASAYGKSANEAVGNWASNIDDHTGAVGERAAMMIAVGVRLLRIPSVIVLFLPIPFILGLASIALAAEGVAGIVCWVVTLVMAAITVAFGVRRRNILKAADDPEKLATELNIMISMGDKVSETRGVLTQLAGGGGWRLFSRLRGAWAGVGLTGHWIDQVGDLPRARYFAPPKIGTTIMLTYAALWLVPISFVVVFFGLIATVSGAL